MKEGPGDQEPQMTHCIYCKEEIYEDAHVCPHCGKGQSPFLGRPGRPRFLHITALVGILAVVGIVLANYLDVPGFGGYVDIIYGTCEVGAEDSNCTFTNVGTASGARCVLVTMKNMETRRSVTSQPVCSGKVLSKDLVERQVHFLGTRPVELCDVVVNLSWDDCDMTIETVD